MYRHWHTLIRPICDIVRPRVLVEVGSRGGLNTKYILEYCRDHAAHAHVIDPAPIGNEKEIAALLAAVGTYHQGLSLDRLPGLAADLFLIDGDHNWYTVFHELRTIEASARAADRWPVCLLHDVGWPYGRRDLYYAPERIPAEHRQPWARRGIAMGRSELLPEHGYNAKHDNALSEGGPKNGVRTGAEDFAAASDERWELFVFPAFHGLGVLWPAERLPREQTDALRRLLTVSPDVQAHMQALEDARMRITLELLDTYRLLGGRPGPRAAALLRGLKRVLGR